MVIENYHSLRLYVSGSKSLHSLVAPHKEGPADIYIYIYVDVYIHIHMY